ncbi:DUF2092 domain-containing protein [Pseudomonas sp. BE134]|uniref:DUF2092 domain-containing protein n=1 Tax=Pseudomonas sp. BE134 TaxID=2817843 RepID=UPI002862A0D1|nr:DUF2092 domain-containing protein [Pseudomonas sp. BE134]MDR6927636.1 hypothetical protein [Pseudomonas sp. BE134]
MPTLQQYVRLLMVSMLMVVTPLHAAQTPAVAAPAAQLEPKALDILKAMSARLTGTQGLSFKAVTTYEKPSRLGPPLAYSSVALVTEQRPNQLRVMTSGDGPATEFYYDGKQAYAFQRKDNLLAQVDGPPTIDAMLEAAYLRAAIYFPFTDVIVADPYKDLSRDMRVAFYIGQSTVVGDTTTDVIAYTSDTVFVQAWIGTEDKLPRRLRAVFLDDPTRSRHQIDFSDWKLSSTMPAAFFKPDGIESAHRIKFVPPPVLRAPQGAKEPVTQP